MCRSLWLCTLCLLTLGTLVSELNAQTTVTTSGGNSATIPVFTGTSTLGNSPIFATTGGFVGIGTSGPAYPLDVSGDINFSGVLRYQGSPLINLQNSNIYFVTGGANPSSTPYGNVAIGWYAFANNSLGIENVAIGHNSLVQNTTGAFNTAIGALTLENNMTAPYNTALGHHAMQYNVTGLDNTALGAGALFLQQGGDSSVAIGINTLYYAGNAAQSGTASNNVGVGGFALVNLVSGYDNVALGDGAGDDISTGVNAVGYQNTYIGASTMGLASGDTNETVIGAYAVGHGSNTITLGNSSTTQTYLNGNVGVGTGTSAPAATLDVNGTVRVSSLSANNPSPICTGANSVLTTTGCSSSSGSSSGTPSNLTIQGSQTGLVVSATNLGNGTYPLSALENTGNLLLGWNQLAGRGEQDLIANENQGSPGGFVFWNYSNTGSLTPLLSIDNAGNVGIGTTSNAPNTKFQVAGNVLLSGTGASVTFPDNTVQATAWNGTTLGGDYAEAVDIIGDRTTYEPGDIIVIDEEVNGNFNKSGTPYSKMVAGVYSTKPGLLGRRTTADRPDKDAELPMAMMGIVPTKVSAENGPIERGDLLVSSSTPGYAMKGTDGTRMMGAIIGKALAPLKSGEGVIEVLITLQ